MGCNSSRPDLTGAQAEIQKEINFIQVPYNFIVFDADDQFYFAPMDKISQLSDKIDTYRDLFGEIKNLKLQQIEKIRGEPEESIINSILELLIQLQDHYEGKQSKEFQLNKKYSSGEAIGQIKGVLKRLVDKKAISNFIVPKYIDLEFSEVNLKYSEEQLGEGSGQEYLPKILIDCMILYPYFADVLKSQLLQKESDEAYNVNYTSLCSIVNAAVSQAMIQQDSQISNFLYFTNIGNQEYSIYFAQYLSQNEIQELQKAQENNDKLNLVFPGTIFGFQTLELAVKDKKEEIFDMKLIKFHIKISKAAKLADGQVIGVHRLFAKVLGFNGEQCHLEEIINDKFKTMSEYREANLQIKRERSTSRETLDNKSPSPQRSSNRGEIAKQNKITYKLVDQ